MVGALATLPQAVAYGLIAFSPLGTEWAAAGILASVGSAIVFGLITAFFGSNKFKVCGPSVVPALVLAVGIQTALDRGFAPVDAVVMGMAGVFCAGVFQLLAGLLRLGHAVSFMPLPVLAGFVNASAILVMLSSVPVVLGIPDMALEDVLAGGFTQSSGWAVAVSALTICSIFILEDRLRFVPAALAGLILGAVLYHAGLIFGGLPAGPVVGHIALMDLIHLPVTVEYSPTVATLLANADIPVLSGLSIGLLNAFTSVLSSTALDSRMGTQSDHNRDLRLEGAANMLMGALSFLPGAGTMSRSSAIISGGAKTRAANVGAAITFLLMLVFLAPIIAELPLWASSGMLLATAVQAIDKQTLLNLKSIVRREVPYPRVLAGDLFVTATVVVTALAFNLIFAVGVGVLLAVALFVLGMGRDPVRRHFDASRIRSKVHRPVTQLQFLEREGHRIAVIEVQGAVFFGTCARLQSQAKDLIGAGAEFLIMDFRHVSSIDSTGCAMLRSLSVACQEAGGRLLLSNVEPERRLDRRSRSRFRDGIPPGETPARTSLRWIWLNMHANGVIDAIGEKSVFDETDLALTRSEDALIARFGKAGLAGRRGIVVNSPLFEGMSRAMVRELAPYAGRHFFLAGSTVFRQGDEGDAAYFLVRGRMDVTIDIPGSDRKKRVSSLSEGTLFAEMALIDGAPRSASVTAVRHSCCFSITVDQFARLQSDRPDIALILLRNSSGEFANRLRLANKMIAELEQ